MLVDFLLHLKARRLPVSTKELLVLLEALEAGLIPHRVDDFYLLARTLLIKDETLYDRFDQAFGEFLKGLPEGLWDTPGIPPDWLSGTLRRTLSATEREALERLGWERLLAQFRERLAEQQGQHQGGNKWVGTGGTSPHGHGGDHPEGLRTGGESTHRRAVKVWDARSYRNLDGEVELGVRQFKVALRKLRRLARTGAPTELDMDGTISATARNGGHLDIALRPERHNAAKVLLFLDIGGSMDEHVRLCELLFSAARSEFKHLEYFYFHNCVYEWVWTDNRRRLESRRPTWEVLHGFGPDYRLIFVGDGAMSPYELSQPGGSIEHWNEESGITWLQRLTQTFPRHAWINPVEARRWGHAQSTAMIRRLLGDRMYPLTLDGLEGLSRALSRS